MKTGHKIWRAIRLLGVLAALAALLCGCSADDVRLPQQVDLFAGQKFALASAVEIEGDPDAADLIAAAALAEKYGVTVEFASEDTTVAAVDDLGVIQAVAPGETTVTVACDAFGYTAAVQVAVLQPAAGLSVTPALQLTPGETASLQPAVENADPADLFYVVENPAVASVDAAGNVTALAEGRTSITVLLPGATLMAGCQVTVGAPAQSIQLSRPQASLQPGQTLTLAAVTTPEEMTLSWQSSDPAVAVVQNGVVTARAAGSAVITAAADGLQAACLVTVETPVETAAPEIASAETAVPEDRTPERTHNEGAIPASPETALPAAQRTAGEKAAAPAEAAATPESAAPQTATPESARPAVPEGATPESATPETAAGPEGARGAAGEAGSWRERLARAWANLTGS